MLQVEAVVNPTNESLSDKNPISFRLYEVAGPELREECKTQVGSKWCRWWTAVNGLDLFSLVGCRTGEARITGGYQLPARWGGRERKGVGAEEEWKGRMDGEKREGMGGGEEMGRGEEGGGEDGRKSGRGRGWVEGRKRGEGWVERKREGRKERRGWVEGEGAKSS